MSNMFAQLAKKATTLSHIMTGREKISTEEITTIYADGITITEFDVLTTADANGVPSTYPVLAFKEDDSKFLYGGKALMDIVAAWINNFDGDVEATSTALKAAGGVKIKMSSAKTKAGRNFTKIEVIG